MERSQIMEAKTRTLVERMTRDDEEAFDELYQSYSVKLFRMAYFITGNRSDSEDILQETFIKCYLHRKKLKQPEYFESWLYQIMVRTAWRANRKKKGKMKEFSFEEILNDDSNIRFAESIQKGDAIGPLEKILENEIATELHRAVNCLDWKYRTVILLYYYNDLSIKEIACVTGTLEGTVKSRLHSARVLLRKQLDSDYRKSEKGSMCHE